MIILPEKIDKAIKQLEAAGHKAYAVGGCVRDCIMEKTPHDWDITTSATPKEIKAVFNEYKTIDVGIEHGTVVVVIDGENIEITTFRIDGEYKDSRHPEKVEFTRNIKEDLARRDFTINAIAYSPTEGIIDPFGGEADIKKRIIRCVGDADKRFNEDALRIMRAIRFASTLDFRIEENTKTSILRNENLIANIAAERIKVELVRLLLGQNAFSVLIEYKSVLAVFMPELALQFGFRQYGKKHAYDVWTHTAFATATIEKDPILRLTMLLHDTGKPATHARDEKGDSTFKNHAAVGGLIAENILRRLKFSNEYIKKVSYLVSIHDKKVPTTREQVKQYLKLLGEEDYIRLMKIRKADRGALSEGYRSIADELIFAYKTFDDVIEKNEPYAVKHLAINGRRLKGIIKDEEIGDVLEQLTEYVIAEPDKNTVKDLMDKVKSFTS